jgi:putative DNA primase/helicase
MIADGKGKGRMNKDTTERPAYNWRVCTLSSGERTLEHQIASGGRQNRGRYNVGQEVRIVPFDPTGQTHGVFDELHGCANGAEFSRAIARESASFYGHAGPQFVEWLIARGVAELPSRLDSERTILEEGLWPSTQEERVAHNFAAVALAGELAIEAGVFPYEPGTVRQALRRIFEAWLPPRTPGVVMGDKEHTEIIANIRQFIERHGDTRFAPLKPFLRDDPILRKGVSPAKPVANLAGYWEMAKAKKVWYFTSEELQETTKHPTTTSKIVQALDKQKAFYKRGKGKEARKGVRAGEHQQRFNLFCIDFEALERPLPE